MITRVFQIICLILIACILSYLLSCHALSDQNSVVTPLSRPPTALSMTPTPTVSMTIDRLANNPRSTIITLTLWTNEQFSPQTNLIAQQLNYFGRNYPTVNVEVILKDTSGPASLLNYLQSAKMVAAKILPDVVVLHTDDLPQAWHNNLIQSLNGRLNRAILQDLHAAAQKLGTVDNRLVGIPFELDTEHIIYNTQTVTIQPLLWSDVLSHNLRYHFPAKGPNGLLNDTILGQYLGANAQLTDAQSLPVIDEIKLQALLNYYQAMLNKNLIDPQILEASSPDDLVSNYLTHQADLIHITTHQYLQQRELWENTQFGPVPSLNGTPITISHGWVLALVTHDPIRQKIALDLIETLLDTDLNVAWARRFSVIPTRQTAFEIITDDDPYWQFLREYINIVVAPPNFTGYDLLSRILQQASVQVISGEATPDEAVQTAISSLKQ